MHKLFKENGVTLFSKADFIVLECLSRSSTGSVYIAKHNSLKKKFILKEKKQSELGKTKSVLHELKILQELKHENVVECVGHYWDQVSGRKVLVMVLEYCEKGDLYHLFQNRKNDPMDEKEILHIMQHMCKGLVYIHSKGLIHRDIKSLNIFIASDNTYKLGDFGISRKMSEQTLFVQSYQYGTPLYMSPELIAARPYTTSTDIWALGVILYELCAFEYPFQGSSFGELMKCISKGKFSITSKMKELYSEALLNILPMLLCVNSERRPTADELLSTINEMIEISDKKAPSVPDVKPKNVRNYRFKESPKKAEAYIKDHLRLSPNDRRKTTSDLKQEFNRSIPINSDIKIKSPKNKKPNVEKPSRSERWESRKKEMNLSDSTSMDQFKKPQQSFEYNPVQRDPKVYRKRSYNILNFHEF